MPNPQRNGAPAEAPCPCVPDRNEILVEAPCPCIPAGTKFSSRPSAHACVMTGPHLLPRPWPFHHEEPQPRPRRARALPRKEPTGHGTGLAESSLQEPERPPLPFFWLKSNAAMLLHSVKRARLRSNAQGPQPAVGVGGHPLQPHPRKKPEAPQEAHWTCR